VSSADATSATNAAASTNKAAVTVNLTVDSSSDPDKLQKQLDLLRKYGVI
jgi:acetolactate synthase regulatory subunit